MAIENLKKDLILPILGFKFTFWLPRERERERASLLAKTKTLVQYLGGRKPN
jgi:hypothetical protein